MTFDRWLAVIGVVGIPVGIVVSWLLARHYYLRSEKKRVPTFMVQSTKVLMESGLRSIEDLSVRFGRVEVGEDGITEAKIYFWNSGTTAILPGQVLEPYTITLTVPILAYSVLKQNRNVIGLQLSRLGEDGNALELGFAVLEPGDGATLRIVYDGPPKTAMRFKGACLDAPKPTILPSDPIYTVSPSKRLRRASEILLPAVMIPVAIVAVASGGFWLVRRLFGEHAANIVGNVLLGALAVFALSGMAITVVFHIKRLIAPYLPPDIKD